LDGNDVTEYDGLSERCQKDLITLATKLTLNYYHKISLCNPILKNVKYERGSGDPSSIWRNIFQYPWYFISDKKILKILEIIPNTK
jgi:hypothetical protein